MREEAPWFKTRRRLPYDITRRITYALVQYEAEKNRPRDPRRIGMSEDEPIDESIGRIEKMNQ
jgi:hypothetical protein